MIGMHQIESLLEDSFVFGDAFLSELIYPDRVFFHHRLKELRL